MPRGGVSGRSVKGQRTKKPTVARKASAAHLSIERPQEQLVERLRRERDERAALARPSATCGPG